MALSGKLADVGSFLACSHSEVDWIGSACATGYGVVIPCFLAFLFAKQHLTMRQCKTFFAYADNKEEVTLQLQVLHAAEPLEDRHVVAAAMKFMHVVGIPCKNWVKFSRLPSNRAQEDAKRKRLVAAAAAYVAVHYRGRVLVSLKKDAAILGSRCGVSRGDFRTSKILVRLGLGFAAPREDGEDDPARG